MLEVVLNEAGNNGNMDSQGQLELLESIDEVLEEAFYFFLQCFNCYHEPVPFRANLNALIQSLRNVTFRVQAYKRLIPDFDEWYERWRVYFRNTPLMMWVNNARTEIVKKKGLESRSLVRVRVFDSYDSPVHFETEVPPHLSTQEIVYTISKKIPSDVREMCIVEVFRQWVLENLPNQEILTGMADCLRILCAFRKDLEEKLLGHENCPPEIVVSHQPAFLNTSQLFQELTLRINPATGEYYKPRSDLIEPDPSLIKKATERYGEMHIAGSLNSGDAIALAKLLLPIATRILKKDGYHIPLLFLHKKQGEWIEEVIPAENQLDKYLLWNHIADQVKEEDIDALVFISEVWMVDVESLPTSSYPKVSDAKDKREALQVYAEESSGRILWIILPFERKDGDILLGEIQEVEGTPSFTMPIRRIWANRG